ncbi:MAG: 16S rRNA (cytosine(1402)-N(4))-methyltransferase RsmH [Armatimonadetes bacterium]|nr:16S rRNA (cytosine(1402)-N(4))-methyltransferase RsmH [Armatimonadota bacterium]
MSEHLPVLLTEVLDLLRPQPGGIYVDATVGGGGHAEAILQRTQPGGRLVGLDRDDEAIARSRARLARFGQAAVLRQANFTEIAEVLRGLGITAVDGVLMDLGVSSHQLAAAERGFSFAQAGPLDMRMDRRGGATARDLVNTLPERDLADLLWRYGEERWSRQIARAVARARPLESTTGLADVVMRAVPRRKWPRGIHPATRTFQALRIAVNDELRSLEQALPDAVEALREGGRFCVITFHSLEDRIVKHTLLRLSRGCTCPPGSSTCTCGGRRWVTVLTRRPLLPSDDEVARNPRARSAKLRAAERVVEASG